MSILGRSTPPPRTPPPAGKSEDVFRLLSDVNGGSSGAGRAMPSVADARKSSTKNNKRRVAPAHEDVDNPHSHRSSHESNDKGTDGVPSSPTGTHDMDPASATSAQASTAGARGWAKVRDSMMTDAGTEEANREENNDDLAGEQLRSEMEHKVIDHTARENDHVIASQHCCEHVSPPAHSP